MAGTMVVVAVVYHKTSTQQLDITQKRCSIACILQIPVYVGQVGGGYHDLWRLWTSYGEPSRFGASVIVLGGGGGGGNSASGRAGGSSGGGGPGGGGLVLPQIPIKVFVEVITLVMVVAGGGGVGYGDAPP